MRIVLKRKEHKKIQEAIQMSKKLERLESRIKDIKELCTHDVHYTKKGFVYTYTVCLGCGKIFDKVKT